MYFLVGAKACGDLFQNPKKRSLVLYCFQHSNYGNFQKDYKNFLTTEKTETSRFSSYWLHSMASIFVFERFQASKPWEFSEIVHKLFEKLQNFDNSRFFFWILCRFEAFSIRQMHLSLHKSLQDNDFFVECFHAFILEVYQIFDLLCEIFVRKSLNFLEFSSISVTIWSIFQRKTAFILWENPPGQRILS